MKRKQEVFNAFLSQFLTQSPEVEDRGEEQNEALIIQEEGVRTC